MPLLSPNAAFKTVAVDVPMEPRMIGTPVFAQGVRRHPSFNALGVLTTNALLRQVLGTVNSPIVTSTWTDPQPFGAGVDVEVGLAGPVLRLGGRR